MNGHKQSTSQKSAGDPIELLMMEHEKGLQRLEIMAEAAKSIQESGFSSAAFQQIADAIKFIGREIKKHNEKEEQYLFPLMGRHVDGPLSVMKEEHRELWRAFRELMKSVGDVEEGHIHGTSLRELIQQTNIIVDSLRTHIEKENTMIFPLAKNVLTQDEYNQLARDLAGI